MADDSVLTPGGFRPASAVHLIEPDHFLDASGGVLKKRHVSGQVVAEFGPMPVRPGNEPLHPMKIAVLESAVPGLGSGWITYASWTNNTGKPIKSFKTTWMVPPPPSTQSGQTIFLFNGIQNSSMIYQPVLQWGGSAAGGGNYWAVASWYVDGQGGPAFHSPLTQVSPGATLIGVMTMTGQSGNLFNYNCNFQGIANSGYAVNNIQELTWCIETLEAYSLTKCTDYPATPMTPMIGIEITTSGGEAPLNWAASNPITDCGQHTSIISDASPGGEVILCYRAGTEQPGWRWCHKCEGMFFGDNPSKGVCPAGGAHDPSQSGRYAGLFGDTSPGAQGSWRWCHKCQGKFFAGNPSQGVCPASGAHDASQSGHYATLLPANDGAGQQGSWRWCHKCQGMFFAGHPTHGVCPTGGSHDPSQSGQYAELFTPVA
jgi:hypothetical protein